MCSRMMANIKVPSSEEASVEYLQREQSLSYEDFHSDLDPVM